MSVPNRPGNGPPVDTTPSELFARLSQLPRPHRIVELPRKDAVTGEPVGSVAMVVLTQTETIAAAASAERRARAVLKDALPRREDAQLGYDDVYNNLAACEILFRACKDVSDPTLKRPAFKTPDELGNGFSNDEIAALHHDYLTVKYECGPIIGSMTPEEVDAWVEMLAKGASAIPLDRLSWGAIGTLVVSMASRLWSLQTAKSSPGSDGSSPDSHESDYALSDGT